MNSATLNGPAYSFIQSKVEFTDSEYILLTRDIADWKKLYRCALVFFVTPGHEFDLNYLINELIALYKKCRPYIIIEI